MLTFPHLRRVWFGHTEQLGDGGHRDVAEQRQNLRAISLLRDPIREF